MGSPRRIVADAADGRAQLVRGLAESHRGEAKALLTIATAKERCTAADDAAGAALCAAASMVTGQALGHFRRFREHIDALAGLRDGSLHFNDHAEALLAYAGMLAGLAFFHPADPFNDRCVERIMSLLERDVDVNLKFAAGRLVLYYTEPREQRELGQRVYSLLQPLMDRADLTPHRLGRWLIVWIVMTAMAKERAQHDLALAQARDLVERHADPEVAMWMAANEIIASLPRRDFERIARALKTLETMSDPANLNDMGRLAWLQGRIALVKGEGDAALFHATRARKYAQELELPPSMLGVRTALEAQARLMAGDLPGARQGFVDTAAMVAVLHAEEMRDMVRMVDAYEALCARRPEGPALLAAAFAAPRARQFYDSFDSSPAFGATMCALALEHGVEVDFVRRIIEVHGMAPPRTAGAAWPWPIRIATLGRFELTRAGAALAITGKTPKKPLELLKALIALGGRGVDKARVADYLWPDAEASAAMAALDMAVSRLRKLLARPDALHLDDGKLGLDAAQVWVDVWAFDRDVEALQAALHATVDAEAEIAAMGERLLALYRGAFLENEEPQRWMLAARDRWRNRFVRSLADAGQYWERRERWPEAIALFERGIEVDTLAEDLYRRSMRCHLAQGRPAEAARVYRRCREMLSVQLGIPPSAETEALFQSIYKR